MNRDAQRLEEYKMLRSELTYFMNKDTTLLTCLFSTITAVLFFSVQWKVQEGCLLAFLIIIPICNKFAYHQKQMAKISTYMVCFLEQNLEIKWETRVGKMAGLKKEYPDKDQKIRGGSILKFTDSLMMACAAFFCYGFILWQQYMACTEVRPIWLIGIETIVILVLLVATCVISGKIYGIQEYKGKYSNRWNAIKKMEGEKQGNED